MESTEIKKEKLLVTSIFSFSLNVFHSYISLVCQNAALCRNGLTSYHDFYTPAKGMFSKVYWNQPVYLYVCPSVYKMLVILRPKLLLQFCYNSLKICINIGNIIKFCKT